MSTVTFTRWPVRVGRAPENDFRLEFPFVSRFHATLDVKDGRLMIRDERSHEGVWVRDHTERLEPGGFVDLEPFGRAFQIGRLSLHAEVDSAIVRTHDQGTVDVGSHNPAFGTLPMPEGSADQACDRALALVHRTVMVLADTRARVSVADPGRASAMMQRAQRMFDELQSSQQGSRAAAESTTLACVQQLASLYIPHVPSSSNAAAAIAFLKRLEKAIALVLEGVVSLRLAHRCATGAPTSQIEASRSALASTLFDWTTDERPLDELRREFGAMVAHRHRLVLEIQEGAARFFEALEPSTIERACGAAQWNPWRYRARWSEYLRRYEALRSGPEPFGRTFAVVARATAGGSSTATTGRATVEPDPSCNPGESPCTF